MLFATFFLVISLLVYKPCSYDQIMLRLEAADEKSRVIQHNRVVNLGEGESVG